MKAKILKPTPKNLSFLGSLLKHGEIIGIPTETVYGLAGDYSNQNSILNIFNIKNRPATDPLIVHLPLEAHHVQTLAELQLIDISKISHNLQKKINQLIQGFWPGPLTLLLPKHPNIHDSITSSKPTVALRMPHHPLAQNLLHAAQTCLVAPSANRFGHISPTTAEAVLSELGHRIAWVLDGGPCLFGIESTILHFDLHERPQILRFGSISRSSIEDLLKESCLLPPQNSLIVHPGSLNSHYAPTKPLYLLPHAITQLTPHIQKQMIALFQLIPKNLPIGCLLLSSTESETKQFFAQITQHPIVVKTLIQSSSDNLASMLYQQLRALDDSEAKILFSEPCPKTFHLEESITDRLSRASQHTLLTS